MSIQLLPYPKQMTQTGGTWSLPDEGYLSLASHAAELFATAQRIQQAASPYSDLQINGGTLPAAITLAVDAALPLKAEGYRLIIDDDGVRITGKDVAGAFYGALTLIQLIQAQGRDLPQLSIEDWPDFARRGVMLDISRDKVPSMATLYELIDLLASWKTNEVQLYTEHTFAYRNHRKVWEKASPMTAEEILALDAYCKERFIDLVPNQNSFGHMHRWFEHEPYLELAEVKTEVLSPWGMPLPPFSLSPAVPGSIELMRELFDELLPNFTSPYFNVGCDETFDLGMGLSKEMVEQQGKGRVYLDFVLKIYELVKGHGRTMQFWGDIINQYPELVPEIPKDTIALEWGYEATHDFDGKSKLFAESGVPFYVCPGTSSWCTIAGRTDNCLGNIRNAVENGLKYGAIGVLNTDWGDRGHWQPLPVSYLGFACGAALSWSYESNVDADIATLLDTFAFHDASGTMGKLAYDLGNAYQQTSVAIPNGSLLFWAYHLTPDKIEERATDDLPDKLHETLTYIDDVIAALPQSQMARADSELIQSEFDIAARMLKHGAKHALLLLGQGDAHQLQTELNAIEGQYRQNWLARNRSGGLEDSVSRFDAARQLYT